MQTARYLIAMAAISGAVIGLELALMRVWMITLYHHLSYFVIGTALLGFGASGTFLVLIRSVAVSGHRLFVWVSALGFALTCPAVFLVSHWIPLQPLQLLWTPSSWGWVFLLQLLVLVPFLCAASAIGLLLIVHADRADQWYAANLVGSGLGASGIIALMYVLPAPWLVGCVALTGAIAALLCVPRASFEAIAGTLLGCAACVVISLNAAQLPPAVDPFKALPGYLRLQDADIVATRHGPLGRIDVVASPAIHEVVDLSPMFTGTVPPQMALTVDAGYGSTLSAVQDRHDAEFLDWSIPAAPYAIGTYDDVLIIGAGGGSDIHLARYHGVPRVTALEINPDIVELLRGPLAEASGRAYEQPGVRVVTADARGWLESRDPEAQGFDLIAIPLLDSFAATSAGVHALSESYLYTVQAIETSLDRLDPDGCLSIVRWIQFPPRDTIKMLATVVEALRRRGVTDPASHVMMVRFQLAANLMVSPRPFRDEEVRRFAEFCRSRNFQPVWYPGMPESEAGQYHELGKLNPDGTFTGKDAIHDVARTLFFGDPGQLYRESLFDVRPATDDRPYFFSFFRWKLVPVLRRLGSAAVAQVEYGYVVLVALLVQSIIVAAALILLPLRWLRAPAGRRRGGRACVAGYFACLGLAYLFLEMALIQKLTLFLASPVLAGGVVLAGFLVFSGVGSYVSGRVGGSAAHRISVAVALIVAIGVVYVLLLRVALAPLGGLPVIGRAAVCLVALAPLAAAMGVPFPQGLRLVEAGSPGLLAWAWGINGFASVIATSAAVVLAMSYGFTALVGIALLLYAVAAVLGGHLGSAK